MHNYFFGTFHERPKSRAIHGSRPKWAFTTFSQIFQQNIPCLKLIRKMSIFWNSIFGTSSYSERGLRNFILFYFFWNLSSMWSTRVPFEFFQGTRVPWTQVLHMELEYFTWNLSSRIFFFFFNFQFTITRLSKNLVLNWNSIFRKSSFKIEAFP